MKRLYIIIAAMIISISGIMAQPGPVQKMAKSVFTLTTFNKDGQIIASTQGVFIDNKEQPSVPSNHSSEPPRPLSWMPADALQT